MKNGPRQSESDRVSCHLYISGVLPAVSEFLETSGCPLDADPGSVLRLEAPDGLAGEWPDTDYFPRLKTSPRAVLKLLRYGDGVGLFERGRGWVLPVRGFSHLGVVFTFRKVARSFDAAIRKAVPDRGILQIKLNMLLRLASELYRLDHSLRERVGILPAGPLALHLDAPQAGHDARGWIERAGPGKLAWGAGTPCEQPRGILYVPSPETAAGLFAGTLIGSEAVGKGEVQMQGNIPAIERLNLVFERIEHYIKPL